jgi:hypothetical protein
MIAQGENRLTRVRDVLVAVLSQECVCNKLKRGFLVATEVA